MPTYNVQVEESVDAKSFYIKNIGDPISSSNRIVITTPSTVVIYPITDTQINSGVSITAESLGLGTYFEDGVYTFDIQNSSGGLITSAREGFLAIIGLQVIKDALSYRIGMDSYLRFITLEKMRILDNLTYCAEIGLLDAFNENLELLKKLV